MEVTLGKPHTVSPFDSMFQKHGFFTEVINDLKNSKISDIISTNEGDVEARERAYTVIKTLDLIMGHIESLAADSKIKNKKWKIL